MMHPRMPVLVVAGMCTVGHVVAPVIRCHRAMGWMRFRRHRPRRGHPVEGERKSKQDVERETDHGG
jgi:hypothetical protein